MSITKNAIFLSASVPDPRRDPAFALSADPVAITSAVSALVHVALGRRLLIWGGEPSITPMIWIFAQDFGVDYGRWVRLYQSRFFSEIFPEDNERFRNVVFTENVAGDRRKSLLLMRERMFTEQPFSAAVFIGGMDGVVEEYELFKRLQPNARIVPVASSGGAALEIAEQESSVATDLVDDLDYVALFHRHLDISVREERYPTPNEQPEHVVSRFWKPGK